MLSSSLKKEEKCNEISLHFPGTMLHAHLQNKDVHTLTDAQVTSCDSTQNHVIVRPNLQRGCWSSQNLSESSVQHHVINESRAGPGIGAAHSPCYLLAGRKGGLLQRQD